MTTTNTNTNKKANVNVNVMDIKSILGMLVNVNNKPTSLVKFVTDTQFIDTDVEVASDYAFPKKAIGDKIHPLYYVCSLNVTFARDVKNVTTGTKEEKIAKNKEILENAVGFKAVCRDLTNMAGKTDKGFLKMSACMPCEEKVNPNKCICGLWVFTSKVLRDKWLKDVQIKINNGTYHLYTGEKGKKRSKRIEAIAKAFGITYEEAEAKMNAVK